MGNTSRRIGRASIRNFEKLAEGGVRARGGRVAHGVDEVALDLPRPVEFGRGGKEFDATFGFERGDVAELALEDFGLNSEGHDIASADLTALSTMPTRRGRDIFLRGSGAFERVVSRADEGGVVVEDDQNRRALHER